MKNGDKPINPIKGADDLFYNEQDESYIKQFKPLLGLTKREYFAVLAMQGLLANCNGGMTSGGSRTFSPNEISKLAVIHAEELLKKLENE